jgi:nucleotide-binding universal stress UspA family protein
MLAIRRILYPTDFSELARPAFDLACAIARDYGAELVVCHVLPPPIASVVDGVAVDIPGEVTEQTLARLEQLTAPDPGIPVVHMHAQGEIVREVLRMATERKVDLIVMGTHGRGGLSRLLMGSVAEQVMRKAPCPVLTVKAPFPAEEVPMPATTLEQVAATG